MQSLDLYAIIEPYLDFEEEIHTLYTKIGSLVIQNDCKNVIDIGCGQGEFCRLLQHNGVNTFGIDLSAKQIEIAKQKDLHVQCIDLALVKEKFDCATAVFDVINYIPKEQLSGFFTNAYNCLETHGKFIFDVNSLFGFEEVAQGTLSIDTDEKFICIDGVFEEKILYTNMNLFEKTSSGCYIKTSGVIQQYYHEIEALKKILKKCGFKTIKVENFNLHQYEEDDKMIFICSKD
ncbi:MAG: class I SAM-dependent methyltransferase [Campylobacterales bacterium]|nr:class I SAM-dependent methyltransferase [Campylobacterales bacterium]